MLTKVNKRRKNDFKSVRRIYKNNACITNAKRRNKSNRYC